MSSGFGCARRAFIKNSLLAAVSASLCLPLLDSVSAQTNTVLAIPKAVTTPDMSTGEWLPNEFPKDNSLEIAINNYPGYFRLNHDDSENLYVLSDMLNETDFTKQQDISTVIQVGGPDNILENNWALVYALVGNGSDPAGYKMQASLDADKIGKAVEKNVSCEFFITRRPTPREKKFSPRGFR